MHKFTQFSLVDFLTNILPPDFKPRKDILDPKSVQVLYNIWKNPNNKIGNKVYKKPESLSQGDLDSLISYGLMQRAGNGLQITGKGSNIIKTMILGDDRSSYDEGGNISYITASNNVKRTKTNKLKNKNKKIDNLWWKNLNGE